MDIFEIFYTINLIIEGIGSVFSAHILSGLSTLMFVVALVVIGMQRHKITKDAARIEQMDDSQKKKYLLISYINMGIPLAISFLLKMCYFYDRLFVKEDMNTIKDIIWDIVIVGLFMFVFIFSRRKPETAKRIFQKMQKFCGITPNNTEE